MPKPTPSPAPASGAETCKHRHAYGCTCGYCITGGCTLLHAKPALPTPPSDAGTSERETPYPPCAYCGGSPWEHEAATTGRTICRQYRSRIVDGAAAPAAEGPREEASEVNCPECETDDDVPCLCNAPAAEGPQDEIAPRLADDPRRFIPDVAKARAIVAARQAAALPVAEAGTPETTAFPDDAEWLVYLDRFVEQTNPQSLPRSIHDRLRAVAAALTSEVRALREVKEKIAIKSTENYLARCKAESVCASLVFAFDLWQSNGTTLNRERLGVAIAAARLASPSPTGAP